MASNSSKESKLVGAEPRSRRFGLERKFYFVHLSTSSNALVTSSFLLVAMPLFLHRERSDTEIGAYRLVQRSQLVTRERTEGAGNRENLRMSGSLRLKRAWLAQIERVTRPNQRVFDIP